MKNNLNFVKIGLACGAGVLSILATSSRLQAQDNLPVGKEVSSNQHLTQTDLDQQAIKARQIEARNYIGSMNRAQQAYFLENNRFTSKLNDLGLGIKPETDNYSYRIRMLSPTIIQNIAVPKRGNLKSYIGIVYIVKDQKTNESLTITNLCESRQPSRSSPPRPQMRGNEPQCPSGFNKL